MGFVADKTRDFAGWSLQLRLKLPRGWRKAAGQFGVDCLIHHRCANGVGTELETRYGLSPTSLGPLFYDLFFNLGMLDHGLRRFGLCRDFAARRTLVGLSKPFFLAGCSKTTPQRRAAGLQSLM